MIYVNKICNLAGRGLSAVNERLDDIIDYGMAASVGMAAGLPLTAGVYIALSHLGVPIEVLRDSYTVVWCEAVGTVGAPLLMYFKRRANQ